LLTPKVDHVETALQCFRHNFIDGSGRWSWLGRIQMNEDDAVLAAAMRACGMIALENAHKTSHSREASLYTYGQAIALLNQTLRHPASCKSDTTLLAVTLLGFCENISCHSSESVQSWKAHIKGAALLLELRGKEQFHTHFGQALYRELRTQILIHDLLENRAPRSFLKERNDELLRSEHVFDSAAKPLDLLYDIFLEFAMVRPMLRNATISHVEALEQIARLRERLDAWPERACSGDSAWQYTAYYSGETPNAWLGISHAYANSVIAEAWNSYRTLQIMLGRELEILYIRSGMRGVEFETAMAEARQSRQQMANDICASVVSHLGLQRTESHEPSLLSRAYALIWPLFFATTCILEQVAIQAKHVHGPLPEIWSLDRIPQPAAAQAHWLLSTLQYIQEGIGMKWASGFIAVLHGDFEMFQGTHLSTGNATQAEQRMHRKPAIMLERDINAIGAAFQSLRLLDVT